MLKIALIHYRLLQKGGLERRLINYLHYFSALGYQVTVFATKKDPALSLPEGVQFNKVNLGPVPKIFRQLAFAKKMRKTLANQNTFDLVLSMGRTFGRQTIMDGGNHYGYMECMGIKKKSIKDRLNLYLDQSAFHEAKIVFACSAFIKNYHLKAYPNNQGKVHTLYPPINTKQFNQNRISQKKEYKTQLGIPDTGLSFLFISTGHKMKNLKFLLQLFAQLDKNQFHLFIAGTSPKSKLPENVTYLGYIKQPEEVYAAVDFTIHPALYEPFGQVIVESILCGTPVVISDRVGAKALVSDKEGIVISGFEDQVWLKTIKTLASRKFTISPDFAHQHKLSIEDHVGKILQHTLNLK